MPEMMGALFLYTMPVPLVMLKSFNFCSVPELIPMPGIIGVTHHFMKQQLKEKLMCALYFYSMVLITLSEMLKVLFETQV